MAALTSNQLTFQYSGGYFINMDVSASDHIFKSAMVVSDKSAADAAIPAVANNGALTFRGIAQEEYNETTGVTTITKPLKVFANGIVLIPIGSSGITIGDTGKLVYASTDGDLTLTAGTSAIVGRIIKVDSTHVHVDLRQRA
jgi:hypothetical protein